MKSRCFVGEVDSAFASKRSEPVGEELLGSAAADCACFSMLNTARASSCLSRSRSRSTASRRFDFVFFTAALALFCKGDSSRRRGSQGIPRPLCEFMPLGGFALRCP